MRRTAPQHEDNKSTRRHHWSLLRIGFIITVLFSVLYFLLIWSVQKHIIDAIEQSSSTQTAMTSSSLVKQLNNDAAAFASAPDAPTTYEIVVTLFHKKELGQWLLAPEIADIPVTIYSPDDLFTEGNHVDHFKPDSDFSHLQNRPGRVRFVPLLNGGGAKEVPGYYSYILEHYEASLPDVTIFLHGNPMAHNGRILQHIQHVVTNRNEWTPAEIGFLHLNNKILCRAVGDPTIHERWPLYYEVLGFLNPKETMPFYTVTPCCAQFMVTRERIQLRSKWFYQQALKMTYLQKDGVFPEHFWHLIFGEPPLLPQSRQLIHYAQSDWKIRPQAAVLHNPYPNVPYSPSMKEWYEKALADPEAYYPKNGRDPHAICPRGSLQTW